MVRKSSLIILALLLLPGLLFASSTPKSGQVSDNIGGTLTASSANYYPSTGSLAISDMGYFSVHIMCDDASDDAINATIGIQTCIEESADDCDWVTTTETVMFPTTATAGATMSITTDAGHYHASVKPIPCPHYRFIVTEAGNQADVTCEIKYFHQ